MIYMLIGIQGSGKSTFAKQMNQLYNWEIISTDNVRATVPNIKEEQVWPIVYERASIALKEKRDAIFDATNITPKVRKRFFDEVNKYGVDMEVCAYYFVEDVNVCFERVKQRNQIDGELYLPPEVVYSYNQKLVKPTLDEGFKFIKLVVNGKVVEE